VNPRIIYARASGWGRDGPEAEEGSFDLLGQARGGLMSINGGPDGPPRNVGAPVADQVGGIMAVLGIMAALWHRERTGRGQQVDTSLLGTVLALQSFNITTYLLSGIVPQRVPRPSALPFWNTYAGGDGRHFVIGILQNRNWPEICDAIGRPELVEDERFAKYTSRVGAHAKQLIALLDEAFAQRPAQEWVDALCRRGVFAALVQDYSEVVRDPQVLANEYIVHVERPDGPPVGMVTTPIQFTETPTTIDRLAPELGQHTEEVLLEAGYSWEEIEALRNEGAIGPRHEAEGAGE
jgi:crotonobetainyl-CoA:carnitine CoA-transferase CaiB-like acyl-CoA transferase